MALSYSTVFFFFFFNDTATTEIYTLSLHDALPIFAVTRRSFRRKLNRRRKFSDCSWRQPCRWPETWLPTHGSCVLSAPRLTALRVSEDRKSTRLNSSHDQISYAVFCLKKKKKEESDRAFGSRSCAGWPHRRSRPRTGRAPASVYSGRQTIWRHRNATRCRACRGSHTRA